MADLVPERLRGNESDLEITWSDGTAYRISWSELRRLCPCATCRTARSEGEKTQDAAEGLLPILTPQEARPLRVSAMEPVGNYAYAIEFNDGHRTGIYTFDYLRELCEESGVRLDA